MKIVILKDDDTVFGTYTPAEQQEDFNNDPMCKAEGLTMSDRDAVDAMLEEVNSDARKLFQQED